MICEYCKKPFNGRVEENYKQRFCSISCANKAIWAANKNDRFFRSRGLKGRVAWNKGISHSEKWKRHLSENHVGMTGKHPSKETKQKMREANLGKKAWNEGKHLTEEHKQKIRESNKGKNIGKIPWNKGLTKFTDERVAEYGRKGGKTRKEDPNYNLVAQKRCKESMTYWKNLQKSLNLKPNKAEQSLGHILQSICPGEYKYVGDFSFILGGKNPDFMNVNGKKKLIELFGDYWHKGEDPQIRIDFFKQFGFDTLVIWEKELKNIKDLTVKLGDFI